jgi:PAS domain S-box-containing protein
MELIEVDRHGAPLPGTWASPFVRLISSTICASSIRVITITLDFEAGARPCGDLGCGCGSGSIAIHLAAAVEWDGRITSGRGQYMQRLHRHLRTTSGIPTMRLTESNELLDLSRCRNVTMYRALPTLSGNSDTIAALLRLVDEPVLFIDLEGVVAGWSQGAEQLLGYAPDDVLGRKGVELIAQDDRAAYECHVQEIIRGGAPVVFESGLRTRLGESRAAQVRLTLAPSGAGNPGSILCRLLARGEPGSRRDVTASQLRELWALMDSLPIAFAHLDVDGRFLYANKAALRNVPEGTTNVIGRTLREVFDKEVYAKLRPQIDAVLAGVASLSELSLPDNDGSLRHVVRHLAPHRGLDGTVKGYFSVMVDITEAKVTQEGQLRREHLLRSTLVREINHRVKNSLQGLIGIMRLYDARQASPADLIDHCASQLMAVAVAFGLASKHGEARIHLTDMICDIADAVEKVSRRDVTVEILAAARRPPIVLTEQHSVNISLVINELIFNAIKHSSGSPDQREVKVLVDRVGDSAVFRVVNRSGVLPGDFSYSAGTGLGTGLGLVKVLVPPEGGELVITHGAEGVVAELRLRPPIIAIE